MADPRGVYDLVFDKIVTALETFSAEDVLVDPTYAFTVEPDYYRDLPSAEGAYVLAYLGPMTFVPRASSVMTQHQLDVTYYLDMVAIAKGDGTGATYRQGYAVAGARLRYLIQQVQTALQRPDVLPDWGLPAGTIGKRPHPRIEPLDPDTERRIEQPIAAARMTLQMEMAWDPTEIEGTPFAELSVDTGYFAALYGYGG